MAKPLLSMQALTFEASLDFRSKPCDGAGVGRNSTATWLFECNEHRNKSRRRIKAVIPPNPTGKHPRRVALLPTRPPYALLIWGVVQSPIKKYFRSFLTQITCISLAVPSHRGAARDRHERGAGCDGRWRRY